MLLRIGFVLACVGVAFAGEAVVVKDVEYGRVGDASLRLDVGKPDVSGGSLHPVVLIVHGGGWSRGDKTADHTALFTPLTDAKFVWFSINYRLAPQNHWPACFDDVQTAWRWVRAHAAEYGGDPRRVAILGYSVGGQLASSLTVRLPAAERPQAVVLLSSPTDLIADTARRGGLSPSLKGLLDQQEITPAVSKTLYEMSAALFVQPGLPPFLLVAGTADQSVPYSQAVNLKAALEGARVPVTLVTMPDAPHAIAQWPEFMPDFAQRIVTWLQGQLRSSSALR